MFNCKSILFRAHLSCFLNYLNDCQCQVPDEKPAEVESKDVKTEGSPREQQPGRRGPDSAPSSGFPNPFDFSAMSGLLNVTFPSLIYSHALI